VSAALQKERRRKCAELVELFPLKWIVSDGAASMPTVTLGQVESFVAMGVLQDEELKDLEAALVFLAPLLTALAAGLDVTLPFPCAGGHGRAPTFAEQNAGRGYPEPASDPLGEPVRGMLGSTIAAARPSTWPCVLHPVSGRRRYFSVYDGICTSEFAVALRLVGEDLRQLLACQGGAAPADLSALQLLAQLLVAPDLGCLLPPRAARPPPGPPGASQQASMVARVQTSGEAWSRQRSPQLQLARSTESAQSLCLYDEDGEWTVVDEGR